MLQPRASALLALAMLLASTPGIARDTRPALATPESLQKQFEAVPCEDSARQAGVKALFEGVGVAAADIRVDAFGHVENVVVTRPGKSSETIVIGAHYDKVSVGCGAIDNWTGLVAISQVYRTLRDTPLDKTLVFVAFGREEKGLVGSKAMTKAMGEDEIARTCAMINIDSLGLGPPQVADNMSSKKLAAFTGELAKELEIPFAHASIGNANSDSSSFVRKSIPAVTIHGLSKDWHTVLHSKHDQAAKVNATSVYLGYRLALAMVLRLDQSACDAYRQ